MGLTNGKAYYDRTGSYLNISGSTCIDLPRYYDRRTHVDRSTQKRVLQSTVRLDLIIDLINRDQVFHNYEGKRETRLTHFLLEAICD